MPSVTHHLSRLIVLTVAAASLLTGPGCSTDEPAPAVSPVDPASVTPTPIPATPSPIPATAVPVATGPIRIDYGDDPAQYGWLRLPPVGPDAGDHRLPIVVLIHGGFWAEPWDYTLMDPMADGLLARGHATWNIEFRRVGGRGGWPTTFEDVSAAIGHLVDLAVDHPIDLDRVVVAGHSSGGHLALWAAGAAGAHAERVRPARAVGIAAVTELGAFPASERFLGGTAAEFPDRWSFAAPSPDPTLVELVHGTADAIVPLFTIAGAEAAGVSVTLLDGADHFDVIESGPALELVLDVIEKALDVTSTR